jgi:integrase
MPRPAKGPRLYLEKGRGWVIRDGPRKVRTGCAEGARGDAEAVLGRYLAAIYAPPPSGKRAAAVRLADVLLAYDREHVEHTRSGRTARSNIRYLAEGWGERVVTDVTAASCRAYAKTRPQSSARRELETLRAAINHWHKEHGPLDTVPAVTLPGKSQPRDRWLTRTEAARLLWGALGYDQTGRRWPELLHRHVARFILIGLYTGTRHSAILGLRWQPNDVGGWVDLARGVLHRRGRIIEESTKRQPPARLGRRIAAHLSRWKRIDEHKRHEWLDGCGGMAATPEPTAIVHWEGQPIQKLRRSWGTACRLAGLEGVTPHVLRHSSATWLMQKGVDAWQTAGFLGMSLITLNRTYGHHHPEWQEDAAEALSRKQ